MTIRRKVNDEEKYQIIDEEITFYTIFKRFSDIIFGIIGCIILIPLYIGDLFTSKISISNLVSSTINWLTNSSCLTDFLVGGRSK